MGISQKLILGCSVIVLLALTGVAVQINNSAVKNNKVIVEALANAIASDQQKSVGGLQDSFTNIAAELDNADATTRQIILDLYRSSL